MNDHPESLYNTKDVQRIRELLLRQQKGIDPILKQNLLLEDAVLDHDHVTQHCRAALHRQSNAFEGLVFNAYRRCLGWLTEESLPDILRNLADYLEMDFQNNPYHVGWIKKVQTEFNQLNADQQRLVLKEIKADSGTNATARKNSFRKKILKDKLEYNDIKDILRKVKS